MREVATCCITMNHSLSERRRVAQGWIRGGTTSKTLFRHWANVDPALRSGWAACNCDWRTDQWLVISCQMTSFPHLAEQDGWLGKSNCLVAASFLHGGPMLFNCYNQMPYGFVCPTGLNAWVSYDPPCFAEDKMLNILLLPMFLTLAYSIPVIH